MARDGVATARCRAGAERHGYVALRHGGRGKMGAAAQGNGRPRREGHGTTRAFPRRVGATQVRRAAARRAGEDGRCGAGFAAFLQKGLAKNLQNPLRRSVCFPVFAGAGYRKRRGNLSIDADGSRKSQAKKRPPPPRAGRRARKTMPRGRAKRCAIPVRKGAGRAGVQSRDAGERVRIEEEGHGSC